MKKKILPAPAPTNPHLLRDLDETITEMIALLEINVLLHQFISGKDGVPLSDTACAGLSNLTYNLTKRATAHLASSFTELRIRSGGLR